MGCSTSSDAAAPGTAESPTSPKSPTEAEKSAADEWLQGNGYPEYWYHFKTPDGGKFDDMFYVHDSEHGNFEDMLTNSYVAKTTQDRPCPKKEHGKTRGGCSCNQPGGDPGLPVSFRVRRVIRVESGDLWDRYIEKKEDIKGKRRSGDVAPFSPPLLTQTASQKHSGIFAPLDTSLNEIYAFHGTQVRYALAIAENAFNIDLAGSSTGTLFGSGAYLCESICKADEYAKDEPGGYYEGIFAVLVCRAVMGKMNCTKEDPQAAEKVKKGIYDSTCGDRTFRELVIYDPRQCYPEYVVLYQRVYAGDAKAEAEKKERFFMQVPLSWRHVATDLTKGFQQEAMLPEPGRLYMQCVVNQAEISPAREVRQVMRLEDASLWVRYVSFKTELRKRISLDKSAKRVNLVETDFRALMKRPCKFFKTKRGCKSGDKCRFSHNPFSDLDDLGLAAGRRLPVDELDRRLNEGFLWYGCTVSQAKGLANGFKAAGTFYESLDAALKTTRKEDGVKVAVLCRVACGVTDEDESADADATILQADEQRKTLLVKDVNAVYPEYVLHLSADEFEEPEVEIESEPVECGCI